MNLKRIKTESVKQMILTVFVLFLIMFLTVAAFWKLHKYAEENCFVELRSATESVDCQIDEILSNTYSSLENFNFLLSELKPLDVEKCIGLLGCIHIGTMNMQIRLYMPDGRIITEEGIFNGACYNEDYNSIIKSFDSTNRYISCARKDYVYADRMVMEFYHPVKIDDADVVISAVMNLAEFKKNRL